MKKGQVRIIGGTWRGRKLNFPATADLRPTPNRIRETLFNWLGPLVHDAHCLDLFAGSGALGFEALSRGAKSVTFIEQSLPLVNYLKSQIKELNIADKASVYPINFPFNTAKVFKSEKPLFNIIFLDPPFNKNLIEPACNWLIKENLLLEKSAIYIESESNLTSFSLPENWQITHSKTAGQVKYVLIRTNT